MDFIKLMEHNGLLVSFINLYKSNIYLSILKKSTKKFKKVWKQILNKDRQFILKLNKTFKNKESLQKCEHFCKKDYTVELNKVGNNFLKKYNIPIPKQTTEDKETMYNVCKRMYCNPQCVGFSPKVKQIFIKS
jgi:hypothetical protein